MKAVFFLVFLIYFTGFSALSQVFTDSNLPIVIINTDNGAPIPDEPKVPATMKIIYRGPGQRNYITDQDNPSFLDYSGKIGIEIRGSSSQATEKKQYGFSTKMADNITNNNVSLLSMPAENDWILNGMVFDPAVIRDYLTYNLSRQIGEYASRTAYCELVLNGEYKGLYLLQEKIKADDNRVNIVRITPIDNFLPLLSGGYITKADKTTGGDPVAWTMLSRWDVPVNYLHDWPEPESVTSAQHNYIRSQFQQLDVTADNSSIANGYPAVIDVPSFIDFMLISELSSNADAYMYSTFFHKDRSGKLRAGPIWDCDLTFGNDLFFWGFDRSKTNVWQFSNGDNEGSRFWYDLFYNTDFRCYLSKRWHELTQPGQPLYRPTVESFIDQTVASISEAVTRENARWGNIGNHIQQISNIKLWLFSRMNWITTNLGSYAACENVTVPMLVITKIMYHPIPSIEFPDEDDLEFIEITNNSDQTVNLTGVYFSNPGLSYQFPVNSYLGPHDSVVIASNSAKFEAKYGVRPFGDYARHLSDSSENIVLADAFGNIIDNVRYLDTEPWPDADGNGYYLQLKDPGLDNAFAENWMASNEVFVSARNVTSEMNLMMYPNPVTDILIIRTTDKIMRIILSDTQGRTMINTLVNQNGHELDLSHLSSGTYIIQVITTERTYTGKIIKE
jgi:hypothetical protein